jgi:hypothetical protein
MNANAQWVRMPNLNSNNHIISIASDSSKIFIGTDGDGLYCSTNNGESWEKTPLYDFIEYSVAVNGNYVFAGSSYQGVLRSTDRGNTWAPTPLNDKIIQKLFIQGNYLYASVFTYTPYTYSIYFSTNNGTNWIKTNFDAERINSFTYDGYYIYAGGYTAPNIYRSILGDTVWTEIANINNIYGDFIGSLAAIGNKVFAGSGYIQWSYYRSIYYSTNNGNLWIPDTLNEGECYDLTTVGNNLIAAVDNGIFLSTDFGVSWIPKNQGLTNPPGYFSNSTFCKTKDYIFIAYNPNSIWRRSLSDIVGIKNINTNIPTKYSLSQNYPNPFNPITNIKFSIVNEGDVKIIVYDIIGRKVQTLVSERLNAGTYETTFDGSQLSSGVYFYRLTTDVYTETKRMVLIK